MECGDISGSERGDLVEVHPESVTMVIELVGAGDIEEW
jgi:hypothetical protein